MKRPSWRAGVAVACGALVAACTTTDFTPPTAGPQAPPAVAIAVTDLPGNWGLASFRKPEDRPRTEKEAKSACTNPYVIGAGPGGGAVMHLADQAQPSEVFIKVARNGQVYIGTRGEAGTRTDRLVESFDNGVLITDWVDPSARERYGTMVLVRCTKKA